MTEHHDDAHLAAAEAAADMAGKSGDLATIGLGILHILLYLAHVDKTAADEIRERMDGRK